jgi:hypothetical protein
MRRSKLAMAFVIALGVSLCVATQQPPASKDKKEQKNNNKEKKDKKSQDLRESVFSIGVANSVLNDVREGLEGHSQRRMLSAFDPDRLPGYSSFEDQVQALFYKYDSFRVHYRIDQSTIEDSKGVVLVDFDVEQIPRGAGAPVHRSGTLRFEMERGRKGWKIVDFSPRGFFS